MIVLGSTGCIGKIALNLAKQYGLKITALACENNHELLCKQIKEFGVKYAYINPKYAKFLPKNIEILSSADALCEIDDNTNDDGKNTVLNAIVGYAGLKSSITAQKNGKKLALANKESLVAGGFLLDCKNIYPIDSEHCAAKFLLQNHKIKNINQIILTASGGAFKDKSLNEIKYLNAKEALKHPNWKMGAKITIDSATMANKLFECLEAFYLFNTKNIDAIIEKSSKIHALIEFDDGTTTLNLSRPDMILSVASAILKHPKNILKHENLFDLNIRFEEIDIKKYPIFSLKNKLLQNPKLGVIINAANEILNTKYLENKCHFYDISDGIFAAINQFESFKIDSFDDVCQIDKSVREWVNAWLEPK